MNRPLADFLPTLTIAAKNLVTEITNYNVEEKDFYRVNVLSLVNTYRIIFLCVKCLVNEELSRKNFLLPRISKNWSDV